MNADGTGYLAQRSMACRSDRDARQAAVVFTVAQIFLRSLLWLPIGLGLLLLFPPTPGLGPDMMRAEREATFVLGIRDLLPAGLKGLMITGMLAALASTVDTHLNWGSSYWTNDLYRRFVCQALLRREPSGRSLVWVARAANLLILALALLIMLHLGSIQGAWQASLLLGAGMGVMLVLRWIWWRVTAAGELAAIGASLVLAPVLLRWVAPAGPAEVQLGPLRWAAENPAVTAEALRLLFMAVGATAAGIGASLLLGPEAPERLQAFYLRARPPGFWGPVAAGLGRDGAADARRLYRGLLAMAVASFSIFCLLASVGSLLAGSPPPRWFPFQVPWIAALLITGTLLLPVWWRLGFREAPEPA
jgi:Na+/proline symporter